ncbi:MAG: ATP-binding protein [Gammaproteobacteria bacterium]|nr:ATP-binding protein [Gammaproteobacteria bacterium]
MIVINEFEELRLRAEELINNQNTHFQPVQDVHELIKELNQYQTQLEMQNSNVINIEQDAVAQKAKMATLDRMQSINGLIYSIAHTQNNSLTVIKNYIYGCIRRLETSNFNVEEVLCSLKKVSDQTRLLSDVIVRMKDFSSKGAFHFEFANVDTIIHETVDLINFEMLDFPVAITYRSLVDLPDIKVDKLHIQQVILNLARNAIEALTAANIDQPCIVIETNLLNNEIIEVSVSDNGPGFIEKNSEVIFDPHYTTKQYGIGLGLAVSRDIIEKHSGHLSAKMNPTGGACFTFTLPCMPMPVKEEHCNQ